jgi:hypothetical protein
VSTAAPVRVRGLGPGGTSLRKWSRRFGKEFTRKVVVPSIVDALNRTTSKAMTRGVRRIAKASKLTAKVVRPRVKKLKANRRLKDAGVLYLNKPIQPGALYKLQQTKRGVSAGKKHRFPGAFVAPAPGGQPTVFIRKGKAAYPLERETIELLGGEENWPRLLSIYARSFMPRRLAQQMDYRARKFGLR